MIYRVNFSLLGTLQCPERLVEYSNMGTYCQFDLFGIENSYYQVATYESSSRVVIKLFRGNLDIPQN